MSILHISDHIGTIKSINQMCNELNITVETIKPLNDLYCSKNEANDIFDKYNIVDKPIIIISDTCMVSRPFLQNMDKHTSRIIIYLTNRIDWGLFGVDDDEYIKLFKITKLNYLTRLSIFADNDYDAMYANIKCNLSITRIASPVFPCSIKEQIDINTITKRWFIINRGTNPMIYIKYLSQYPIIYDTTNKYSNMEELANLLACIHIPYQVNIQTIHEAWMNGIIFCIPTQQFHRMNNFYWEETKQHLVDDSFLKSVWYNDNNNHMFEFFNSWDECNLLFDKLANNQDYYIEKRRIIQQEAFNRYNHSIKIWKEIILPYPVIVSMFYNIEGKSRRSKNTYLELASKYILQTPCQLVIFSDDIDVIDFCLNNRKFGEKIKCINIPFKETKYYEFIPIINQIQQNYTILNGNPEHETPEYIVLNCNKFYFIEEAIKIFNEETHFMWMDFGINHIATINPNWEMRYLDNNKISQLCINPLLNKEIQDAGDFKGLFTYIYHHLAGGCFVGDSKILLEYCDKFYQVFKEIIDDNWFQLDEAIMTIVASRFPDMFQFYYGDYESIINNNPWFVNDTINSTYRIKTIIEKLIDGDCLIEANEVIKMVQNTFPNYFSTQINRFII